MRSEFFEKTTQFQGESQSEKTEVPGEGERAVGGVQMGIKVILRLTLGAFSGRA